MTERTVHSIEDLEKELAAMIEQLGPQAFEAAKPAMQSALDHLLSQIPPYPSSDTPKGAMKEASAKARGYFFWAVKQGMIPGWTWVKATKDKPAHAEGRYRQTGHLGQSITTEVTSSGTDVTGEIGSKARYAPWVIGPDYPGEQFGGKTMWQAKIHKDRWWQFQDVIDKNIEDAWAIFDDELISGLAKAISQD